MRTEVPLEPSGADAALPLQRGDAAVEGLALLEENGGDLEGGLARHENGGVFATNKSDLEGRGG